MGPSQAKLRILIIAPTPFFADRGCHVRIFEEIKYAQARGHEVLVCTYHLGRDLEGIAIRRSVRIPWYNKLSAGPSWHKFYVDLLLLWTVIRAGLSFKPDIIHAHLHEGIVIGKLASGVLRVPFVVDLQGSLTGELVQHGFMKEGGLFYRIVFFAETLMMRFPQGFLLSSQKHFPGLPSPNSSVTKPITVVPDGVDTRVFSPNIQERTKQELRQKLNIPPDCKVIGYLGVLTEYQGVSVLLHAAKKVVEAFPTVRFLIMGYPNVNHYQELACRLGLEDYVVFSGRLPYEHAPRYLALCHVAVSPKFHSTEANGKLLNYMAMGLPVVASDTQVNRDILGQGGRFFEVGDVNGLAEALLECLKNEDEARRQGGRLRQRVVEEFSWDTLSEHMIETYWKVLGKSVEVRRQALTETCL